MSTTVSYSDILRKSFQSIKYVLWSYEVVTRIKAFCPSHFKLFLLFCVFWSCICICVIICTGTQCEGHWGTKYRSGVLRQKKHVPLAGTRCEGHWGMNYLVCSDKKKTLVFFIYVNICVENACILYLCERIWKWQNE